MRRDPRRTSNNVTVNGGSVSVSVPDSVNVADLAVASLSGNSSTANINNGASFTGTWEQVTVGDTLVMTLVADRNLDISVQYSPDGTNIDSTLTRYYRTGRINPPQHFVNMREYVRIVVSNNSGSATTYLRLNADSVPQTVALNIPVDSVMAQNYSAVSTRPTDFHEEVALGLRQGWSTWNKFGYNSDVDTGTETIWAAGGALSYITASDTLSIVSSDANDTSAGTGARTVTIFGLDANYDQQSVTVTMNGLTPVAVSGNWIGGINRAVVATAGSGGVNAGNITITRATGGTTQAYIPAGEGTTQQAFFFVPRDHKFLATWLRANINKVTGGGGSPVTTLRGWATDLTTGVKQLVYRETLDTSVDEVLDVRPPEPFVINEKSLLEFTAQTDTNNTVVTCRFSGKLVRDIDA